VSETAWGEAGQHSSPASWYPLVLSGPSPSPLPSFPLFVRSPCGSFPPLLQLPVVLFVSMSSYPSSCLSSLVSQHPPSTPRAVACGGGAGCWVVVVSWRPALALVVAPHFHPASLWGWGWVVRRSVFLGPGTRQLHEKEEKNLQETSASTSPRPSFPFPSSFVLLSPLSSPRLL
jgi:hypothetical protein